MLEMQPKWKIERIKKLIMSPVWQAFEREGVGGSKILTRVESTPGTTENPASSAGS